MGGRSIRMAMSILSNAARLRDLAAIHTVTAHLNIISARKFEKTILKGLGLLFWRGLEYEMKAKQ